LVEIRHLAYFIAACQHLHLAKAAAEMDVAQSTLSMALKAIEEDIGVPLLARAKVGLLPTPPALWLFQATTPLLHAESFARHFVPNPRDGTLEHVVIRPRLIFTIGRLAKAVSCVIETLRPRFPSTYFEPRWDVTSQDVPSIFAGDATSVTIDYAIDGEPTNDFQPLLDDPWVLAREMPTSAAKPDLGELLGGPVNVPTLHPTLLQQASRFIAANAFSNARFTRDDPGELPRIAGNAPDTAFLIPSSILSVRLGLLRMRTVPIPGLTSKIVARASRESEAASAFVETLKKHLVGEERNVVFHPQLTLRQIRYFRAIYQSRHLTAAAKMANIAQPALSSQLFKVEKLLGQRLFDRQHDGLLPTPAGNQFFHVTAAASTMASKLEEGRRQAHNYPGGYVRIGILPAIDHTGRMLKAVSAAINQWRSLHPTARLQALEGSNSALQKMLLDGTVGMAIVETDLPQLARFSLGSAEDLCVIANPRFGLVSADEIPLSDLSTLPLALPTAVFGIRQALDAAATQMGGKIRPEIEIDSLAMLVAFVMDNPSATILPASAVGREIVSGLLRSFLIVEPNIPRKLYLIYANDRPLSAQESDLIRLLRSSMELGDIGAGDGPS
jgi:LysR family nitrogen assimilation transcriptional regulator